MLALRHRSRQIVVTDEELHGTDMVGELLGKGQRVADQPCNALPQRGVSTFDVIGFARSFADRFVLRRRNHLLIYHIVIRVKCGVLTVCLGNLCPQLLGALVAAIAHVQGN
jgi:hypothetical protein